MYATCMKRLQILIEEDLDAALERTSRAEKRSKAALIRQYVRERLKPLPPLEADPLWQMVGIDDYEPEPIDDVVYR
jgi:Ribbon-helix-helix protein, copG family